MCTTRVVSIVVSAFHEAQNLPILVERIAEAMKPVEMQYEIVVVDDDGRGPELIREIPVQTAQP